ncbi:MAG: hypothetical protein HRU21_04730 [Pseudomonadales bacterium]|nr:hypothetical protein [Pseudomonadales bacterium]
MCFSATASFAGAAVIASIGAISYRNNRLQKHQYPFAAIPFVFAFHQFSEGMVWLSVQGDISDAIGNIFIYLFAFIAFSFWPIYVPYAMWRYENKRNNVAMFVCLLLGTAAGLYLLWGFTAYSDLQVKAQCDFQGCHSLAYLFAIPAYNLLVEIAYLCAATLPFVFSAHAKIRWIIFPLFLASYVVGIVVSTNATFASVWCFIAAMLSISIYFVLPKKISRNKKLVSEH